MLLPSQLKSCLQTSLFLLLLSLCGSNTLAQSRIPLSVLPETPDGIRELIQAGRVTLVHGQDSEGQLRDRNHQSETSPEELRTALAEQNRNANNPNSRSKSLSAMTVYRVEFRFTRTGKWAWNANQRLMTIQCRARLQSWQPIHTIWFRNQPNHDNFWKDRLVLHEFDHVQLSTEPSMRQRFTLKLRKGETIKHYLDQNEVPSDQLADKLTDQWVQRQFEQIVALVDLRYQELDRLTQHGLRVLPKEASFYPLLRPDSP